MLLTSGMILSSAATVGINVPVFNISRSTVPGLPIFGTVVTIMVSCCTLLSVRHFIWSWYCCLYLFTKIHLRCCYQFMYREASMRNPGEKLHPGVAPQTLNLMGKLLYDAPYVSSRACGFSCRASTICSTSVGP